jgi:siderophore synthetase component
MPVNPWQCDHRITVAFAAVIAVVRIFCLVYVADRYQAQQSIRTLFNRDRPDRCYVKLALSVLNMGFMRGLSPDYMGTTPAINAWLYDLVANDPTLRATGFTILREVAAMGYRQPHWEAATPKGSPYRKMLAALWRESPVPKIEPGQRLMTMAALLHRDRNGDALPCALIRASGLGAERWLRSWLDCYLMPLLHCFYAHDLVFMPHGTNVTLIHEQGEPKRIAITDFVDEVALVDRDFPELIEQLPPKFKDGEQFKHYILKRKPQVVRTHRIVGKNLDGIGRFVSDLLAREHGYSEERFWQQLHQAIQHYHERFPEFEDRFELFDLYRPRFRTYCLTLNRMLDTGYATSTTRPTVQYHSTLYNPLLRSV